MSPSFTARGDHGCVFSRPFADRQVMDVRWTRRRRSGRCERMGRDLALPGAAAGAALAWLAQPAWRAGGGLEWGARGLGGWGLPRRKLGGRGVAGPCAPA